MQSLTKSEKRIKALGSAEAGKRYREKNRAGRMVGVPVALGVAKVASVTDGMLPSFDLPGLGQTKLTTIAGYAGCLYYLTAKNPGTAGTVVGLSSLVLAARGM